MTDIKTESKVDTEQSKIDGRRKKAVGKGRYPVRKEVRLDEFTKGLLEKMVLEDRHIGKTSTDESDIVRESIQSYYESRHEPKEIITKAAEKKIKERIEHRKRRKEPEK